MQRLKIGFLVFVCIIVGLLMVFDIVGVRLINIYRPQFMVLDYFYVTNETSENLQLESHLLPIRGPGDSYLPLEDLDAPIIDKLPGEWFKEKPYNGTTDGDSPPLKKILFWNNVYGNTSFYFGFGREAFLLAGCRINTCLTTANRSRFPLEDVDAVIWHPISNPADHSLPTRRSPHTRYVFWLLEPPVHMGMKAKDFRGVFNWTFTYRLDSDIYNPYGAVYRRLTPAPVPVSKNYAAGKTLLAAWMVSHCVTAGGRETLVKTLQRWIRVDIYGTCGPLKCSRSKPEICMKMLEKEYKFYLSFENSLCQDYATEKLFNMLKYNIVPVVYGLGNYTAQLPPHSYIDAFDFPSAKMLAAYLHYLDRNDTAYNEYFRWKQYHTIPPEWTKWAKPWCDLCERLHSDQVPKVYDLDQWVVRDAHCLGVQTPEVKSFIRNLPLPEEIGLNNSSGKHNSK